MDDDDDDAWVMGQRIKEEKRYYTVHNERGFTLYLCHLPVLYEGAVVERERSISIAKKQTNTQNSTRGNTIQYGGFHPEQWGFTAERRFGSDAYYCKRRR